MVPDWETAPVPSGAFQQGNIFLFVRVLSVFLPNVSKLSPTFFLLVAVDSHKLQKEIQSSYRDFTVLGWGHPKLFNDTFYDISALLFSIYLQNVFRNTLSPFPISMPKLFRYRISV